MNQNKDLPICVEKCYFQIYYATHASTEFLMYLEAVGECRVFFQELKVETEKGCVHVCFVRAVFATQAEALHFSHCVLLEQIKQ